MHPVLEEIARAKQPIRPEVFRAWQRAIKDVVIPEIQRLEAVEKEQVSA